MEARERVLCAQESGGLDLGKERFIGGGRRQLTGPRLGSLESYR